jgi:hypothetical protein
MEIALFFAPPGLYWARSSSHLLKDGYKMSSQRYSLKSMAIALIFGLVVGCSTPAKTPTSAENTATIQPKIEMTEDITTSQPQIEATDVLVTSTIGVTPTQKVEPTFTPTLLATETQLPSPTPTITLTPPLVYNAPGFYGNVGGCVTYGLERGNITVDFCVASIEVVRDSSMFVSLSWAIHNKGGYTITKRSDANNRNMYMTDDLGNRYGHDGAGGDLVSKIKMHDGDTSFVGWYHFSNIASNAKAFTFHDDDQKVQISNMVLVNPQIIKGQMALEHYPFALEYLLAAWKMETTAEGAKVLMHTQIPQCQIAEGFPAELQGKYKNTIAIGMIEYKIYGSTDNQNKLSLREYLAVKGVTFSDPAQQPFFRVTIPFDNGTQCLTDVGTALSTLYSTTE